MTVIFSFYFVLLMYSDCMHAPCGMGFAEKYCRNCSGVDILLYQSNTKTNYHAKTKIVNKTAINHGTV